MAVVFKNNAKTTLAGNITTSATSITVTDGSIFPSLSGGDTFFCTFDDGTNNEIVSVTARSGNTLTVVRAQDSTTAKTFTAGDAAELRLTAGILNIFSQTGVAITDEIEAYLDANGTTFPDNVKAQFGAGNDLQIFHDGSNSYVSDVGTGNLILKGGGQILLKSPADENMITATGNGAVGLFYDNAPKLYTTSTGIDVTGTINSGKITASSASFNNHITVERSGTTMGLSPSGDELLVVGGGFAPSASATRSLGRSDKIWSTVYSNGYRIGTTTVIDSSRNLTNIGTINSGAITSSGKIIAPKLSIQNQINTTSSNLEVNYENGDGTTTSFKDFYVRDGKNGLILNRYKEVLRNATFAGTINSGAITSSGNLLLDSASAEINLKSGIGTESGAINWTFNTTATNYASNQVTLCN